MKKESKHSPVPYEVKFAGLIELCKVAKEKDAELVVIDHPEVLGDNYREIVESLNRISQAGLQLLIVSPDDRKS